GEAAGGARRATLGVVSVGGCHRAVLEALERLAAAGLPLEYMRIRGFPFDRPVKRFLERHDLNFVVEQNRDAQLRSLLLLETDVSPERLASVRYYGGLPLSWGHVVDGIVHAMREREIRVPAGVLDVLPARLAAPAEDGARDDGRHDFRPEPEPQPGVPQ
ncbi:MAG: hypothetical protein ACOC8B_03565, partial [Gemmatimonadota bacterium]